MTSFTVAALVVLSLMALAFVNPCVYEGYTCGYNMIERFGKPS